jgi:hypothetical protein
MTNAKWNPVVRMAIRHSGFVIFFVIMISSLVIPPNLAD